MTGAPARKDCITFPEILTQPLSLFLYLQALYDRGKNQSIFFTVRNLRKMEVNAYLSDPHERMNMFFGSLRSPGRPLWCTQKPLLSCFQRNERPTS